MLDHALYTCCQNFAVNDAESTFTYILRRSKTSLCLYVFIRFYTAINRQATTTTIQLRQQQRQIYSISTMDMLLLLLHGWLDRHTVAALLYTRMHDTRTQAISHGILDGAT